MTIRGRIAALAVALAVVCAGPAAYGQDEDDDRFRSRARSEIIAGDGIRLKLTNFQKHFGGSDYQFDICHLSGGVPSEVPPLTNMPFCYVCTGHNMNFSYDLGFLFYYDILVPDGRGGWMPSGYWVDGAAKVAFIGDRVLQCAIKRTGSTTPEPDAPFSCEIWWTGSGKDSSPHWKIRAKDVKTIDASIPENVDRAAQLIGDNCQTFDTPRCKWTRTQKSSAIVPDEKDWVSLTNWADSCAPATKEFTLKFSNTKGVNFSDTFGGKISGKFKGPENFIASLEVTIEADYHHTITHSDSFTEEYTYSIPLGYRSALYLQHGMLEVTGDFAIIAEHDRYLVKNATFLFPLTRDVWVAEQRVSRGIVQHVDIPCSAKPPRDGEPPPHRATFGLATPVSKP